MLGDHYQKIIIKFCNVTRNTKAILETFIVYNTKLLQATSTSISILLKQINISTYNTSVWMHASGTVPRLPGWEEVGVASLPAPWPSVAPGRSSNRAAAAETAHNASMNHPSSHSDNTGEGETPIRKA